MQTNITNLLEKLGDSYQSNGYNKSTFSPIMNLPKGSQTSKNITDPFKVKTIDVASGSQESTLFTNRGIKAV